MIKINRLIFCAILILLVGFWACTKDSVADKALAVDSCEGCHTNYEHLQKVFSPDTEAPAGGCGGEAPHYEPYDRVFMGGDGYEEYKKTAHYTVGCVGCHNGTDKTDDKEKAHGGNFVSHPSAIADQKCASCHKQIVDNFKTSIHNGTGQKRKVAIRSGLTGAADFDKLPQHQIEGYNKNCATCHGSCGNCHVVRPLSGGGGLAAGHAFKKTPDMVNVCVTCHVSRGGHAYLGVASGTKPDAHLTQNNFQCIDCHGGAELHGDGKPVDQRYAYTKLPKCENCHTNIATKNPYHSMHYDSFNCQVCHSQEYNNCGSCHVHGEGARVPSYQGFKIAMNPIPSIKKGYNFSLVRRTLAAPDNWKEYGVPNYSNFNAFPTYNYTTPHNLLRWTPRTKITTGMCFSNCHIRNEGGVLVNKKLYLFKSDLLPWELPATTGITVDDRLPAKWLQPTK